MRIIKYSLVIIFLFFLTGCQTKLLENKNSSNNLLGLTNQSKVKINGVELKVEIAKTPGAQALGLSGRAELCQNCGLLFIFPDYQIRSFWMKDVNFPLDIIWLKDKEIVGLEENIPILTNNQITTINSPEEINKVLEVNAGWAKDNNVGVGDKVEFFNIN